MKAHLRYYYKVLVNSHKYIPPTLFFIIAVMSTYLAIIDRIFYGFQVSAIFMYITAIWITYNFNEIEDTTQKQLVLLNTNNEMKYYVMRIFFLFIYVLALNFVSILFPILIGTFNEIVNVTDILFGFLMQAVIGFLGIAVANLFESKILKDRKASIMILLLVMVLSCIQGLVIADQPAIKYLMLILPPAYYVYQSEGMNLLFSLAGALVYSFILIFIYVKLSIKKKFW